MPLIRLRPAALCLAVAVFVKQAICYLQLARCNIGSLDAYVPTLGSQCDGVGVVRLAVSRYAPTMDGDVAP